MSRESRGAEAPPLHRIKQSAADLVDALRGAPNQVGVVTFGTTASVAAPAVDVHDDAERSRLKESIDELGLAVDGATNWEEALLTAESLDPDVVLFLTDGVPTASGTASTGYTGSSDNLTPAVRVADRMRGTENIRIVGVGMGLQPGSVTNLAQVTGPVAGDDYYETGSDAVGLLDKLYDVASKTCGIPVPALPQPEGGHFPVVPVIAGTIAAALALGLGGYLMSRRRNQTTGRPATVTGPKAARLTGRTIKAGDVAKVVSDTTTSDAGGGLHREPASPAADTSQVPPMPPSRSTSLSWLHGDESPGPAQPADKPQPAPPRRTSLSWLDDDEPDGEDTRR